MGAHDLYLVCTSIRHVAGGRPQGDARSGWQAPDAVALFSEA